ncbi:LytTR family DNA-binding domain-containing protein [Defluviimonas aestuarii]|uniref:LytTR family DNA-binding domain-containing protein n=1 Tax=Albidovulum aestuarii TaxID=1130726 RepID=UPI00249A68D6|nr:LytTR family DNA-binding domain-containing protein [Defluviimonas aestuarii]MDI3336916.1 LytTR family DNA-binding domain-containing protein [Defluviimonas aestuarii]
MNRDGISPRSGAAGLLGSVALRYVIAIAATAALMVWQAGDAVRAGADLTDLTLFWTVSVTAGWLQMILIARGVRASFGADRYPGWSLLIASSLIGAVPLTFEVRWLMESILAPRAGLPPPWVTYLNVTVINTVFSLIQYVFIERWPLLSRAASEAVSRFPDHPGTPPPASPQLPAVNLLRRQPEGVNGVIRFLQMEDHYLRVHTDDGSGLVLYRMSDAAEDLAGTDGMQVHRSWWVSRAAVDSVRLENRKRTIVTKSGAEIPVGRSFEPALRKAGWF